MELTDTILLLCKALERIALSQVVKQLMTVMTANNVLKELMLCCPSERQTRPCRPVYVPYAKRLLLCPSMSCQYSNYSDNYQPNLIKIRIRKLELITCRWKGDVNNFLAASRTFKMYTFKTACYYPPLSEWEIEESYREREHRMKDRGYSTCFTAGFPPC